MKLSLILETIQDQLEKVSEVEKIDVNELKKLLKTYGGKNWKWLLNQVYNNIVSIDEEDLEDVQQIIQKFEKIKKNLDFKDINQFKSIGALQNAVDQFLEAQTLESQADIEKYPNTQTIKTVGPYSIIKTSNPDALAEIGAGTKWCTRKDYNPCQADRYINKFGHIYIMLKNYKPILQWDSKFNEINDAQNIAANKSKIVTDPRIYDIIDTNAVFGVNYDPQTLLNYLKNVPSSKNTKEFKEKVFDEMIPETFESSHISTIFKFISENDNKKIRDKYEQYLLNKVRESTNEKEFTERYAVARGYWLFLNKSQPWLALDRLVNEAADKYPSSHIKYLEKTASLVRDDFLSNVYYWADYFILPELIEELLEIGYDDSDIQNVLDIPDNEYAEMLENIF